MKRHLPTVVRVAIGALMLVTGVLKFVKPEFKEADNTTLRAFIDSGWLWPLIGAAETLGGAALLSGLFVPLGLAALVPVVLGIFAFSLKVQGEEAAVGVLLVVAHVYLLWQWRDSFSGLVARRSTPSAATTSQRPKT
jgi:putative oxidoreductase